MKLNSAGIKLIKHFEGCRLAAYQDGAGVFTIGYGSTQGVKEGLEITQEQADALLLTDLEIACSSVTSLLHRDVNENQFSALVSFTYNLGFKRLEGSTLLAYLNEGGAFRASLEFARWNKVSGKISKGLVNRRAAEKFLFLALGDVSSDQKFNSLLT